MPGGWWLSQNTMLRSKRVGGWWCENPWGLRWEEMWMLEWKGLLCGLWPKYWPLGLGLGLGLRWRWRWRLGLRLGLGLRLKLRLRLRLRWGLGPNPGGWKTGRDPRRKVMLW